MSVVKVQILENFTVLYNAVLENPRLSFKAKGLWAYCMSRPKDWEFHVNHLATVSQDGKESVYSALKELEDEGLVEKVQERDNGKFSKFDYIIYPYPQEIQIILPQRQKPDTVKPDTENPPLLSTDCYKEMKETTTREPAVVPLDDPDKIEESLKSGGVPKETYPEALETWNKYKEEIRKKSDNPIGYLIWMVKKGINPFKGKEMRESRANKRKEWAYSNETTTNSGGRVATKDGMEVMSGSISTFYRYDEDSEFWEKLGL